MANICPTFTVCQSPILSSLHNPISFNPQNKSSVKVLILSHFYTGGNRVNFPKSDFRRSCSASNNVNTTTHRT